MKFRILILLLGISILGSSQIQTIVDGRNRNAPCIGENVTYICTVPVLSHAWNVPRYDVTATISVQTNLFINKDPGFIIRLMAVGTNTITSSLSVISFAGLNGTRITCTDSVILGGESQEIVVNILGIPSAPSLEIETQGDLTSLSFTVSPPIYAVSCVLHYDITSYSSGNSMMDFTAVPDSKGVSTVDKNGFDLCRERYNFTVGSHTRTGEGMRSGFIPLAIVDFIDPVLTIANNKLTVSVLWMVPTVPRAFNVSVSHSAPNGDDCVENASGVVGREWTQVQVAFNCSYAGSIVTFCVQFTSATCQSNVAKIMTSDLPALVTSEQITYSEITSSNSIALLIDINEEVTCDNREELQLSAMVLKGNKVVASRTLPFSNTIAYFSGILQGEYNCTTSTVIGTIQFESTTFNCTSFVFGTSESRLTAISVSLSFVYLLSIAASFSCGLLTRSFLIARKAASTRKKSLSSGRHLCDLDY